MKLDVKLFVERRLGDPQLKISIDDYQTLYEGAAQDNHSFDFLVSPGPHTLKICHYGKQVTDHAYDEVGNIAIDKHVLIQEIAFDNIQLRSELWDGKFYPVYWAHDSGPSCIKPNLYLGYNGTWSLNFVVPTTDWLIQRRKSGPQLERTIFKSNQEILKEAKDFFRDLPDV